MRVLVFSALAGANQGIRCKVLLAGIKPIFEQTQVRLQRAFLCAHPRRKRQRERENERETLEQLYPLIPACCFPSGEPCALSSFQQVEFPYARLNTLPNNPPPCQSLLRKFEIQSVENTLSHNDAFELTLFVCIFIICCSIQNQHEQHFDTNTRVLPLHCKQT